MNHSAKDKETDMPIINSHLNDIQRQTFSPKAGFTLIELSIVLVVIGLIVGGIIAGKSLIDKAAINSTMAELEQYQTVVQTFKDKFKELPGDLSDASDYWPTCATNPLTCNGNGNGLIDYTLSWMHLSRAGMITGNYPIITTNPQIGVDFPESPVERAGYGLSSGVTYGKTGNYFILQRLRTNSTIEGALSTLTASQLDKKYDDNKPATGNFIAINQADNGGNWQTTGCVNGGNILASPSAISWNLANEDTEECVLVHYLEEQ